MKNKKIVPVHHFTVVLKMPSENDAYLNKTKGIYKSVTNVANFPVFPTSDPTLTPVIFEADIKVYDDSESNLMTKPPLGTTDDRDAAKEKVARDLEFVRQGVQALVTANPANARKIAANAGMEIKVIPTHGGRVGAKPGVEPNTWDISDVGPGPHEWRISTDGETWTPMPATRGQKTTTPVLTRGTDYEVQSRQILTNGKYSDWSQSIQIKN